MKKDAVGSAKLLVIISLMLILYSISVAANPTITLTPNQVYESSLVKFVLNISNFRNTQDLTQVQILSNDLNITSAVSYTGWSKAYDENQATWSGGLLTDNIVLALFEHVARAPVVESDVSTQIEIILTYSNGDTQSYNFPLQIINDETPPLIEEVKPLSGTFIKQGETKVPVKLKVSDPELNLKNVTFHWVLCGNIDENTLVYDHTLQLAQYNGFYQTTIDLSNYMNGQQICFDFKAYNEVGEKSEYDGVLTIDHVPPNIHLVSPVDGAVIGLEKNFSFFAEDNFAPETTCSLYVDGIEKKTGIKAQHMDVVFISSKELEEGEHTWSINCKDLAGLESESIKRKYTLDKTLPVIEMTALQNNSIIFDLEIINFEVTDDTEIKQVWYVYQDNSEIVENMFGINVSEWQEGPNEFAVIAKDYVGNRAEQTYRMIVDKTPPQIELLTPTGTQEIDVHVNLEYVVLDNYDKELDCIVQLNELSYERVVKTGEKDSMTKLLAAGEYRWKVQCVDDAKNKLLSEEKIFTVIDKSGPDIQISSSDVAFRGDLVELSLVVSDISGIGVVTAKIRDPYGDLRTIPLEKVADTYVGSFQTSLDSLYGKYGFEIEAVDILNYSSTKLHEFVLTQRETEPNDIVFGTTAQTTSTNSSNASNSTTSTQTTTAPVTQQGSSSKYSNYMAYLNYKAKQDTCRARWSCIAWTPCKNKKQTRVCVDMNNCDGGGKEIEERECDDVKWSITGSSVKNLVQDTVESQNVLHQIYDGVSALILPNELDKEADNSVVSSEKNTLEPVKQNPTAQIISSLNSKSVLLSLFVMFLTIAVFSKFIFLKSDNRKHLTAVDVLDCGRKNLELESYLEKRSKRRTFSKR